MNINVEEARKRISEYQLDSIDKLDLSHLDLEKLPSIPNGIVDIDFSYNKIKVFPLLPPSVKVINCSYNLIKKIDNLPNKLQSLNCSYNLIKSIDNIPSTISYLNVSHNMLSKRVIMTGKYITLIDNDNKYNAEASLCFNSYTEEYEDVDFYLTSSKNNLILSINNMVLCTHRDELFENIIKEGREYIINMKFFEGIALSQKDVNYLKNPNYSIYSFTNSGMRSFKREDIVR